MKERGGLVRRWQVLWLLRRGEKLIRVKAVVGVSHRTIQQWVRWYEAGGIEEVAWPKQGNGETHRQSYTAEQEGQLKQAVSEGRFRTSGEALLRRLEAEGRLSTLVGWSYIREALQALPK